MISRMVSAAAALSLVLALTPAASQATVGYFSLGYGTRSKGMAGAGIALPQDATISLTNPAGIARVGTRLDVGLALFNPERGYTVSGAPSGAPGTFGLAPGSVASGSTLFAIPHLAYTRLLGPNRALAIAVNGNGGMNTTYPTNAGGYGTFGGGQAGVNLEQLFITPTYATAVGPRTTVGFSALIAYQRFEARGLRNFGGFTSSGGAANLTDNGDDRSLGLGARAGVLSDLNPRLTIGLAYQSQVLMGKLGRYSDLFAGEGGFDIPASLTVGLAYRTSARSVLALDVQHIWYSAIHSVANPFSNLREGLGAGDPSKLLGGDNGPGFGWRDVTAIKAGYQWEADHDWTLRAGLAYNRQPIPSSEVLFNILAPGVQEWHFTAGFSRKLGRSDDLSVAVVYSPVKHVAGPNPLEVPGQQQIDLHMRQLEFEVSWGKRF